MSRRKVPKKSTTDSGLAKAAASESAREQLNSWKGFAVVAALFLLLSQRLMTLISSYAVNIFSMDEWDFHGATLFEKHSLWEMFRWQHGPHGQGMGALLAYFAEPHFQWNSRSEAFLAGIIVILAAVCALYLKTRLFGPIGFYDVCIPLIFLNPLQHESLFGTTNFAHGPLPVLLVLLYCLAWTISSAPVRYSLVLFINFATIYTGFGLFLGIITPIALAADYWLNSERCSAPLKTRQSGPPNLVQL
jgi:hypothetical protein